MWIVWCPLPLRLPVPSKKMDFPHRVSKIIDLIKDREPIDVFRTTIDGSIMRAICLSNEWGYSLAWALRRNSGNGPVYRNWLKDIFDWLVECQVDTTRIMDNFMSTRHSWSYRPCDLYLNFYLKSNVGRKDQEFLDKLLSQLICNPYYGFIVSFCRQLLDAGATLSACDKRYSMVRTVAPWYHSRQTCRAGCIAFLLLRKKSPFIKACVPRELMLIMAKEMWTRRFEAVQPEKKKKKRKGKKHQFY